MPINPNIALSFRPTTELQNPQDIRAKALAIQSAQNQLAESQRVGQERNAMRDIYRQAYAGGGDIDAALIKGAAERGLGDQIPDLIKNQLDQRKTKMDQLKTVAELQKRAATVVYTNPEMAEQVLMDFGQRTGTDITNDLAQLRSFNGDPNRIRQWAAGHAASADQLLPKIETRDLGGTVETQALNPLTGQPVSAATSRVKTQTPGESERIDLEKLRVMLAQAEGRRSQQRLDRGEGTPAPTMTEVVDPSDPDQLLRVDARTYQGGGVGSPGVLGASGKVSSVAGSSGLSPKEIQKREAKYPVATSSVKATTAEIDKLISDLKTLKLHKGVSGITGLVYGRTPNVTAEARAAQAVFDKIMARGGFSELQKMRAASPTGGALGNVSDVEGRYLRQAFAALDKTQDTKDFKDQITSTIDELTASKQRITDAYDLDYEYRSNKAAAPTTSGATSDEQRRTVTRTGTQNGRKVVQYSDGSIEYAD
ncbi:MAG: hypothetical protein WC551_10900 [Patescibacteria group bacterium]